MLFLSSSLPFPHPMHIFFLHFHHKKSPILKYRALTYLSIGFYSGARNCNKKSPYPEGEEALHLKFFFQFFFDEPLFFFWNI